MTLRAAAEGVVSEAPAAAAAAAEPPPGGGPSLDWLDEIDPPVGLGDRGEVAASEGRIKGRLLERSHVREKTQPAASF